MHKTYKILYWSATVVICSIMLYSALMYFIKTEMIEGFFESINYSTYIVIPLAIAKLVGIAMILYHKLEMVLASTAHLKAGHGVRLSVYGLVLLLTSYFLGKKVRNL